MKKLLIVIVAVASICIVGQAYGLPYTYSALKKPIKKGQSFKIEFEETAQVQFKLTIQTTGRWEKYWRSRNWKNNYLYLEGPGQDPVEVFYSNPEIKHGSRNVKFLLSLPMANYRSGDVIRLYADKLQKGESFKVTKLKNSIGNNSDNSVPVPEPTTLLLFGGGLFAMAGIGRKKLFKI